MVSRLLPGCGRAAQVAEISGANRMCGKVWQRIISPRGCVMSQLRSSRQRYQRFLEDYKRRRLDDPAQAGDGLAEAGKDSPVADSRGLGQGKRREYLREYARWLWPH